jgi:hypothetical protein
MDNIQIFVSAAGLLLAVVGLPILYVQLRELQRSVRSSAHAALYAQSAEVRSHLVAYPHLRKYFVEGAEISKGHEDYDRVVTIAELFLNTLEHIAVTTDSFGRGNRAALERFVRHTLDMSPIMRIRLGENRADYSHALLRYNTPLPAKGESA